MACVLLTRKRCVCVSVSLDFLNSAFRFSFIQKRSGVVRSQIDDNILFTAAISFYRELKNSEKESLFKNAFREVKTLHRIYETIYKQCQ